MRIETMLKSAKTKLLNGAQWPPAAIKALRVHTALTQEAFAMLTGIQQSTLARLETGNRRPTKVQRDTLTEIDNNFRNGRNR